MSRVLVVGGEARRVCGFGDFASDHFLERVDALACVIEGVHEMHGGGVGGGTIEVRSNWYGYAEGELQEISRGLAWRGS